MPSSGERTLNVPVEVEWTFFEWTCGRLPEDHVDGYSSSPKPFLTWSNAFQCYVRMPRDVLYKHIWIPKIRDFAAFEVEAQWGVQFLKSWADSKYHRWSLILKIFILLPAIIEPHFGIICCQSKSSTEETSWKLVWGCSSLRVHRPFAATSFHSKINQLLRFPESEWTVGRFWSYKWTCFEVLKKRAYHQVSAMLPWDPVLWARGAASTGCPPSGCNWIQGPSLI